MKIIFFGTPQFAAETLEFLLEQEIQVVCIITKPDKPKGRSRNLIPTPVKLVAQRLIPHIPVYQPELVSAQEFSETIKEFNADMFVVVAYGEIIKQHLLDMPHLGCINLHASILPKYRGAAPIQRAIMQGETESGITIMHMVRKMDAGDMIKVVKVPIEQETTYGELEQTLCHVGSQALLEVLHDFEKGIISGTPQNHNAMTLAPKIELEDCQISWFESAQKIHDLIRGVNPYPGAWCFIYLRGEKKRLKVISSKVVLGKKGDSGAVVSSQQEGLIIACGKDAVQILTLQLEGKKVTTAEEFLRGFSLSIISFVG
jgi:methionyl-tRNA formyltransferase